MKSRAGMNRIKEIFNAALQNVHKRNLSIRRESKREILELWKTLRVDLTVQTSDGNLRLGSYSLRNMFGSAF